MFLSSITIYFDQKLIFVPAIIFFSIQFLNLRFKYKLLTLIFYSIFALPYVYLIFLWETVIPPSAANARSVGTLYLFNIGYLLTIIYILYPPIFFCADSSLSRIKSIKLDKKLFFLTLSFLLYIFLTLYFENFYDLRTDGKGAFHKISSILIANDFLRLLITITTFFICFFFIYFFFQDKNDFILILYFVVLSLFTFPFYQEYLDPLIYILLFSFFKTKLNLIIKELIYYSFTF